MVGFYYIVIFGSDVALCVDMRSGVLHVKRDFGGWGHMWNKCHVAWKGLNIFNNRIIFLSRGVHNVEILLSI